MKIITIAVAICLALAIQSALADETIAANTSGNDVGTYAASSGAASSSPSAMKIATELLLQEDATEVVPAKEEKADQKKKDNEEKELKEAPLMADAVTSEEITAPSAQEASEKIDALTKDSSEADAPKAGTLEYEMDTVGMLADAPAEPTYEKAPAESKLAKR